MDRLKILVVDDDKITTNILLKMLDNAKRDVYLATSGQEGLELFNATAPDILLSDINMPGMNGLEMIRQIRSKDDQVKIAIFTNFDNKAYLLEAIQLGVNQFFCKPFEKAHFIQVINRLSSEILERREIQSSLNRHQNILETVNTMSQRFLQHNDWDETLLNEMHSLKEAAEASTIFIYKNEMGDAPKLARRHLSINDNSDANPPTILPYKSVNLNVLKNGQNVNGLIQSVEPNKQALFYEYRVNSLLILPIFSNEKWWGFLGIGNNDNRIFDSTDENTLKTVAQLIGAALDNQYNLNMLKMRSAIFKHTVDGVMITNEENRIIHVNDAFSHITGFLPDEAIGKNPKLLRSGIHDKTFYREMWHSIDQQGYWQGEIKNRNKNGEMYIAWLSINAIKNRRGVVENHIAIFSDVTAQRSNDKKYVHLATHDPLTGLSNRLILNDRLEHAVHHADRTNNRLAVFFCDLDNFKPINDTYGHDIGDQVLQQCAEHFKHSLRSEDTICRYGGDEFVIILEELNDAVTLKILAEKLMSITEGTTIINGHSVPIEMSVGVAFYPDDSLDGESLIKKADEAMYKAKRAGKNQICCYQPSNYFLDSVDITVDDRDFAF